MLRRANHNGGNAPRWARSPSILVTDSMDDQVPSEIFLAVDLPSQSLAVPSGDVLPETILVASLFIKPGANVPRRSMAKGWLPYLARILRRIDGISDDPSGTPY